jgi:hypothetical protein
VETKCLPFDIGLLAICRWNVSAQQQSQERRLTIIASPASLENHRLASRKTVQRTVVHLGEINVPKTVGTYRRSRRAEIGRRSGPVAGLAIKSVERTRCCLRRMRWAMGIRWGYLDCLWYEVGKGVQENGGRNTTPVRAEFALGRADRFCG